MLPTKYPLQLPGYLNFRLRFGASRLESDPQAARRMTVLAETTIHKGSTTEQPSEMEQIDQDQGE